VDSEHFRKLSEFNLSGSRDCFSEEFNINQFFWTAWMACVQQGHWFWNHDIVIHAVAQSMMQNTFKRWITDSANCAEMTTKVQKYFPANALYERASLASQVLEDHVQGLQVMG
jgi:hypothetical protein